MKCLSDVAANQTRRLARRAGGARYTTSPAKVIALARKIIGAYDGTTAEKLLGEEELRPLKVKRNSMNRYVTEFFQQRQTFGRICPDMMSASIHHGQTRLRGEMWAKTRPGEDLISGRQVGGQLWRLDGVGHDSLVGQDLDIASSGGVGGRW